MQEMKQQVKQDNAGQNPAGGAGSAVPDAATVAEDRTASFGQTMKAVLWSFLGIRKRRDHDQQTAKLNPVHVVVAALLGVATFIFVLLMIVKSVVAK